ncbi:MAG: RNA polymerase sigma factor [Bacteroidales bacterium]|nr:RNA polymerase sigma factor [Bacteroidales bacterium]MBN2764521.1 RNA polymerase sigma factor [Bacteroidales bacterium]
MTDSEIIKLILQGDREKYRVLVDRYQSLIFRTCMGFVHNKEDADDLTQDVFIQVFRSLSRFKGEAAFSTWIYRIAVNASLNRIRKSKGYSLLKRIGLTSGESNVPDPSLLIPEDEDPESVLIREEHHAWLQNALDSLPEKQRTALVLSKYDELPQKDIAAILNTTEGAVEALIQRAKANLRKKLKKK